MKRGTDRRSFLQAATATALAAASYSRVLGANERVGIGLIGYGSIGKTHAADFTRISECSLVAIADCYRDRAEEGASAVGGRTRAVQDFRHVLDSKDVDAVVIATPDHWHALMTLMACAAGKDVFVQKPLTLFVREGEWLQQVAQRTGRIVQVGTQQRSGPHYQKARQLIQSGHIGTITSVRIEAVRNIYPGFGNPPDSQPPPRLDYDLWLGPAPMRPYNPHRVLYHFRWFWDYSGGQMTNLGSHQLDIVDWYLGLGTLRAVASMGGRYVLRDSGETPDTQDALFDCGNFTIAFVMREAARGEPSRYVLRFYGTKGTLGIDRRGFVVWPDPDTPPTNLIPGIHEGHPVGGPRPVAVDDRNKLRTEPVQDASGDPADQHLRHARNFVEAVKTRTPPISDLASGHRTCVACHLANISLRLGRSVRWDWDRQTVVDDPEATAMLTRAYREPWDRQLRAIRLS